MALKFVLGAFALATFSVIYITGNQDVLDWPVILGSDASLYCAPERSAEKHGKTDWVKEAGWHRKEADGTWTWVAGVERHNSTSEWRVKVAAGSRYKKFGNGFLRIQNVSKADNNTMYRCTIVGSDTYMEPFEVKLYVMEAKAVQAVDGGWSSWSEWTDCSVSCGGGVQNQSRTCTNPPPAFGGKLCPGLHAETRECNENHCPVDGNWSKWLDWTDCSLTCGTGGFQNRSRVCTNPAPEFGGNLCLGPSTETRPCFGNPCPVDGNWSPWYYWSECSTSCGGGVQSRARFCTDPPAAFGGKPCAGESLESRGCNSTPCSEKCIGWIVACMVLLAHSLCFIGYCVISCCHLYTHNFPAAVTMAQMNGSSGGEKYQGCDSQRDGRGTEREGEMESLPNGEKYQGCDSQRDGRGTEREGAMESLPNGVSETLD